MSDARTESLSTNVYINEAGKIFVGAEVRGHGPAKCAGRIKIIVHDGVLHAVEIVGASHD